MSDNGGDDTLSKESKENPSMILKVESHLIEHKCIDVVVLCIAYLILHTYIFTPNSQNLEDSVISSLFDLT